MIVIHELETPKVIQILGVHKYTEDEWKQLQTRSGTRVSDDHTMITRDRGQGESERWIKQHVNVVVFEDDNASVILEYLQAMCDAFKSQTFRTTHPLYILQINDIVIPIYSMDDLRNIMTGMELAGVND